MTMDLLNNKELRELAPEQLEVKVDEWRRKLLELRLNASTTHIKTFSSDQKKLKSAIARALTHLREKQLVEDVEEV